MCSQPPIALCCSDPLVFSSLSHSWEIGATSHLHPMHEAATSTLQHVLARKLISLHFMNRSQQKDVLECSLIQYLIARLILYIVSEKKPSSRQIFTSTVSLYIYLKIGNRCHIRLLEDQWSDRTHQLRPQQDSLRFKSLICKLEQVITSNQFYLQQLDAYAEDICILLREWPAPSTSIHSKMGVTFS